MQKLPSLLASIVLSGVFGLFAVASAAHAQSTGVALLCGVNVCDATATSPGSPTPFTYNWSFSGTAHLSAPFHCNNSGLLGHKAECTFQCLQPYQDHIIMHVTALDATGAYIGEASAGAVCNGSPGDI
jgi:hypothetical protein